MKKLITLAFFFLLSILSSRIFAQIDKYDWDFKFGWAIPSFVNFGDTKEWVDKGTGNELLLAGLGYKNIHLNLSYKYFNGLKSKNLITFGYYQFPNSAVYREVFMDLTVSYEYEMIRRFFIEPQIGWVRSHITSNVVDNQGKEILINNADGLIIGSNLTKYIKLYNKFFLGVFVNLNYNLINYQNISEDLGGNTLGYGFGLVIKGTN